MAENLRTTHYQNGDSIPEVTDNNRWGNMTSGAFCNYNNTTDLDTIASNKMKEAGNIHWADAFESTNSSGFTALPGGFRYLSTNISEIGFYGDWWVV